MADSVFVGRESELQHLAACLDQARAGHAQVVFVSGEAGAGKTVLVNEFVRRAQESDAQCVAAVGQCNAQTGAGDAYLPFRDVLTLLTGAQDDKRAVNTMNPTNLSRLKEFVRVSSDTLLTVGPDLVGLFVPGAALLTKIATTAASKSKLAEKLAETIHKAHKPTPTANTPLDQDKIFQQYANVLRALSKDRTLIVILDDLHWADSASLSLLFYLARSLAESRVLIVGTYRPDDVALGRGTERHPLEPVLNELKRYYGDIVIDLAEARTHEGRAFVDALIDAEPNQLDEAFREELFTRTGGHPLFTVEMLRNLKERGDLVKDAAGRWVTGSELDWDDLPARVEGVIAERIARVAEDQRETLIIASVMGNDFIAQAIARVQKAVERELLRYLSRDLDKRHHLVQEEGESKVGNQFLTLYRFAHALFQQYLYNELGAGEKRLLHGEVAAALEDLYAAHTDEIAVQLARHYQETGDDEKTAEYAALAGDVAKRVSAMDQARTHYRLALNTLAGLPNTPDRVRTRIDIAFSYSEVDWTSGKTAEKLALFEPLQELAQSLPMPDGTVGDRRRLAYVHHLIGNTYMIGGDLPKAMQYFMRVLDVVDDFPDDPQLQAVPATLIGGLNAMQGYFQRALPMLERAMKASESFPNRWYSYTATLYASATYSQLGDLQMGRKLFDKHLPQLEKSQNLTGLASMLNVLPMLDWVAREAEPMLEHSRRAYEISLQSQDRLWQFIALTNQAVAASYLGQADLARSSLSEAHAVRQQLGPGVYLGDWASALDAQIMLNLGAADEALHLAEHAILDAQAMGGVFAEAIARRVWAQAAVQLNPERWGEAQTTLETVFQSLEAGPARMEIAHTHVVYGELLLTRGEKPAAREHFEKAIAQFEKSGLQRELARVRALAASCA